MKPLFILFSVVILPAVLAAQPVVTNNELYNAGTIFQMVNCNASGVTAGAPGTGIVWNFSGLQPTGDISTTTVEQNTTNLFYTSNIVEMLPGDITAYLSQGSINTIINGTYNANSGITTYYNDYKVSARPFTYNTAYIDSYLVNIPGTSTYGIGTLTEVGDAYGTLILPTGTFNNVLRIRKLQEENDTTSTNTGSSSSLYTITVSYLWFDATNNAPLLRMDSITSLVQQTQDIMYLAAPTAIKNVKENQYNYTCYFDYTGSLVINGLEPNQYYQVALYNIIGNKMFSSNFFTLDNSQQFDANRALAPGIYIVNITPGNTQTTTPAAVIKVVKNY